MRNKPLPSPPPVAPATRAEVGRFLKGLQEFRAKSIDVETPIDEADVKKYDEAGVKKYLDNMRGGSLQSIARRIMIDIMKSPVKGVSDKYKRKRTKKRPTKKKKTAPKAKSKRAPSKSKAPKRSAAKKKKGGRRR
jgi:hypothetical protein